MRWWEKLSKMSQEEILTMSREYSARSTQFDNGFVQWRGKGPLVLLADTAIAQGLAHARAGPTAGGNPAAGLNEMWAARAARGENAP